jgi:hypothetical protein
MTGLLVVSTLLSLATPASAPSDFVPRRSLALAVSPAREPSALPVAVTTHGAVHLSPRLALAGEVGVIHFFLPQVLVGPTLYVLPPRPGWLSPFVAAKAGGGALWLCFLCGENQSDVFWTANATGGLEFLFPRSLGLPNRHLRLVAEGGLQWIGPIAGRGQERIAFGRLGAGVTF